jgi:hypothetical protein
VAFARFAGIQQLPYLRIPLIHSPFELLFKNRAGFKRHDRQALSGQALIHMFIFGTRFSPMVFGFLLIACLFAGGCAPLKKAVASTTPAVRAPDNAPLPGPDAKINISYSRPGDFLDSLTVTEYSGAETVLTESGKVPQATIIRFDGGIMVWQIGVMKKLLADVPMFRERKSHAVAQVIYGKVPAHFVSIVPESGPPQPLEPDHYYVFTVTRAYGATSYEAVKVNGDGSLQAYAADPRAGDSFRLCCDVAPDFVVNANAMTSPDAP